MAWTLTGDLDEFLAAAGGFLRSEPVPHTIELAAVETLQARGTAAFGSPGALFGWWRPGTGRVTATLFHTPPYPLLLTPLPAGAAPPLARAAARRGRRRAQLRRPDPLGGRRDPGGGGRGQAPGRRGGPGRARLHPAGAAAARLRGGGHRGRQPGRAGRRRERGGAVHRP